jgi:hypothetical protein
MPLRADHRISKALPLSMHAIRPAKTPVIPSNRFKERVPIVISQQCGGYPAALQAVVISQPSVRLPISAHVKNESQRWSSCVG